MRRRARRPALRVGEVRGRRAAVDLAERRGAAGAEAGQQGVEAERGRLVERVVVAVAQPDDAEGEAREVGRERVERLDVLDGVVREGPAGPRAGHGDELAVAGEVFGDGLGHVEHVGGEAERAERLGERRGDDLRVAGLRADEDEHVRVRSGEVEHGVGGGGHAVSRHGIPARHPGTASRHAPPTGRRRRAARSAPAGRVEGGVDAGDGVEQVEAVHALVRAGVAARGAREVGAEGDELAAGERPHVRAVGVERVARAGAAAAAGPVGAGGASSAARRSTWARWRARREASMGAPVRVSAQRPARRSASMASAV